MITMQTFWSIFFVFILIGLAGCASETSSYRSSSNSEDFSSKSALAMLELAFEGDYSRQEIKLRIDRVMQLYGLPITEENYSRFGSVLVALRKETGVPEMEILTCMSAADYRNTLNQNILPQEAVIEAAAICSATLAS